MSKILTNLKNPETIVYVEEFETLLNELKIQINFLEDNISSKLKRFSCLECKRLDEALVCFENYSFYACIVMAVSSVEHRIHELIKRSNKKMYSSLFKNSTLGQLLTHA